LPPDSHSPFSSSIGRIRCAALCAARFDLPVTCTASRSSSGLLSVSLLGPCGRADGAPPPRRVRQQVELPGGHPHRPPDRQGPRGWRIPRPGVIAKDDGLDASCRGQRLAEHRETIGPVHLMKSDGALDEPAPCPTDLRKRLPKHKRRGVQKQDGDGDTDDDIWPMRLEPGY